MTQLLLITKSFSVDVFKLWLTKKLQPDILEKPGPNMKLLLVLLLGIVSMAIAAKDFYKILGVSKNANDKEIKTAFRQLTLKYHPDKNNGDQEAHDKFIEIGEAYEVLSDPQKRDNYDKYGDANGPMGGGNPFGGGGGDMFGDMFNQFFGGHHQQQVRRGENTQGNIHVGLKDFYNGKVIDFDIEMVNICETCKGSGSKDGKVHKCNKCQGSGHLNIQRQLAPGMIQNMRMQCDECRGKGNKITSHCNECHGNGAKPGKRHYDIYLKPGQPRDSNIVLEGEGDKHPDIVPGDLILLLKEDFKQSWGYRRVGRNLYRTEVLTLHEATTGNWKRTIKFFDEIELEIILTRDSNVSVIDGEIEIIKGKGMPPFSDDDHDYGDLFIEYKILMPSIKSKISEKDEL